MTRFGSLTLCITLGSALLACGSNTASTPDTVDSSTKDPPKDPPSKDPVNTVPLDNDVSGWTVDQEHSEKPGQRAMVGKTYDEVTALIDGAVNRFYFGLFTPKTFLWQNYLNASLKSAPPPDGAKVKLYILQMPTAEQAAGLYTAVLQDQDHQAKAGTPDDWKDPSTPLVGTSSRIQDTGSQWWINFRKDVYYVELWLTPSEGPAPDYLPGNAETKQEAFRFAQAIAAKM